MSTTGNEPQIQPSAVSAGAPVSSAPTVPEDYEELKRFRSEFEPVLQRVAPLWESDIAPLIDDESERDFVRRAREAYKQQLESQKPKLSPELQAIRDEFRQELDPIVSYVRGEKEAREKREAEEKKAAQDANLAYARRLEAERPDLAENNYRRMHMLAAIAQRDGISLEEAWKQVGSDFHAPVHKEKPPTSLRGGAAAPGVPGESKDLPIKSSRDLRNRLAANLRATGMRG